MYLLVSLNYLCNQTPRLELVAWIMPLKLQDRPASQSAVAECVNYALSFPVIKRTPLETTP